MFSCSAHGATNQLHLGLHPSPYPLQLLHTSLLLQCQASRKASQQLSFWLIRGSLPWARLQQGRLQGSMVSRVRYLRGFLLVPRPSTMATQTSHLPSSLCTTTRVREEGICSVQLAWCKPGPPRPVFIFWYMYYLCESFSCSLVAGLCYYPRTVPLTIIFHV